MAAPIPSYNSVGSAPYADDVGQLIGASAPPPPRAPVRRLTPLLIGLACVVLVVASSLLTVGVTVAAVELGMRSSDAFQLAVAAAQRDPTVVAELGAPVEPGWLTPGRIEVSGPMGKADLAVPLSGPRGSGTLYLVADKSAGKWTFKTLRVDIEGRPSSVDLLAAAAAP